MILTIAFWLIVIPFGLIAVGVVWLGILGWIGWKLSGR